MGASEVGWIPDSGVEIKGRRGEIYFPTPEEYRKTNGFPLPGRPRENLWDILMKSGSEKRRVICQNFPSFPA